MLASVAVSQITKLVDRFFYAVEALVRSFVCYRQKSLNRVDVSSVQRTVCCARHFVGYQTNVGREARERRALPAVRR